MSSYRDQSVSVRPVSVVPGIGKTVGDDDEGEVEDVLIEEDGIKRIGIPKEGEFVRKMLDPCKPSKEAVEMHWLQGHVVFRNWCPICVRSKSKDDPHKSDDGKAFQNIVSIIVPW